MTTPLDKDAITQVVGDTHPDKDAIIQLVEVLNEFLVEDPAHVSELKFHFSAQKEGDCKNRGERKDEAKDEENSEGEEKKKSENQTNEKKKEISKINIQITGTLA
jgi:hypothetical protein